MLNSNEIPEDVTLPQYIYQSPTWDNFVDKAERIKIERIRAIDPLLNEIERIFQLILLYGHNDCKAVMTCKKSEESKEFNVNRLIHIAIKTKKDFQRLNNKETTPFSKESYSRLIDLFKFADLDPDQPEKVLHHVFEYHEKIMKKRGLFPWFTIVDSKFKKNVKQVGATELPNLLQREWLYSYYVYNFNTLSTGIQGLNDV